MPITDWRTLLSVALMLADGGTATGTPAAAEPVPVAGAPAAAVPAVEAVPVPAAAVPAAPASPEAAILAEVVGLHNDKGLVGCALWNTEEGFPTDAPRALRYEFPKPEGRKAICRFEGFPAGTYAIVVYHDENSNKHLDQGFLGIPTEGYGASNDARSFMAPPSFSKAKFEYPGKVFKLQIHMGY